MSDFLTLVQDLHARVGAAGVAPTTVVSQTGEARRLVQWIREADYKIQVKWINWKFLHSSYQQNTTALDNTLAAPADLKTWDLSTFSIQENGAPADEEYPIDAVEYEQIKTEVLDTDTADADIPTRVIVMPDGSLQLEPVPDAAHTIRADYYKKPTKLVNNTDISVIPEEYHDSAILGRAMMFYANFEHAPEIKTEGTELYVEGLAELENHQLPNQNYSRFRTGGFWEVIGSQ